jgi:hypothetical protein
MRDTLANPAVKLQFAGHETFPLRLLWLKKAFDATTNGAAKGTFQEPSAIAMFGVGRNMAISMRHWAIAADVLADVDGTLEPTALGRLILDTKTGLDPYLEHPATLWTVHGALASTPQHTTTWFFAFNGLNQTSFDRELVAQEMLAALSGRAGLRLSPDTLKRDFEVFVRSYVGRRGDVASEDTAEPLLTELGLIRETRLSGQYEFVRGPKATLPDGIFALFLRRFWRAQHDSAPTLSLEQASYGIGSPGRIFKLDEDSVLERLSRIEVVTDGAIRWTDTAGLRQVVLVEEVDDEALLRGSFHSTRRVAA